MTEVPEAAIAAALARRAELLADRPTPMVLSDWRLMRQSLEAALPHLPPPGPDLTAERWRQGGGHKNNVWAMTGFTGGKPGLPAGRMDSAEIAARACADHNAMLDLTWLFAAGHDVALGVHDHSGGPACYVRLLGCPGEDDLESFSGRGSLAQALADARGWSEREGITP